MRRALSTVTGPKTRFCSSNAIRRQKEKINPFHYFTRAIFRRAKYSRVGTWGWMISAPRKTVRESFMSADVISYLHVEGMPSIPRFPKFGIIQWPISHFDDGAFN